MKLFMVGYVRNGGKIFQEFHTYIAVESNRIEDVVAVFESEYGENYSIASLKIHCSFSYFEENKDGSWVNKELENEQRST